MGDESGSVPHRKRKKKKRLDAIREVKVRERMVFSLGLMILKLTFKHRVLLIAIRVVQSIQALLGMIAFLYNKRKRRGRMSSSLHTR